MTAPQKTASTLLFGVSPFLDGFLTVATGFIVAYFLSIGESTYAMSFLASGYVGGALIGCSFVGTLADRFGRRPVAITLLILIGLVAIIPTVSQAPWVIILAHATLGLLVGADQPVSLAIVAEASSEEKRQGRLALLMLVWYIGALVGVLCSIGLQGEQILELYFLPVILALITLPFRLRMAESQAWRDAKAQPQTASTRPTLRTVLQKRPRELIFCTGMWLCQTIPVTVFLYYSPVILGALTGGTDPTLQIAILYSAFLIGAAPMAFGFKPSPSFVLTATFGAMALGMAGIAFTGQSPMLLLIFVVIYALGYGMQTTLDYIYPNILFPTDIRTTASGWVFALARVGSATAAFLFPFLLKAFGTTPVLLGGALIALSGISWLFVLPKHER